MVTVLLVAVAGFTASLVDGALGMGFGPTSSTILLAGGLAPAAVSTTVNLAKIFTGAAGGVAHWRFGNVDKRLVLQLAGPGCVGAAVGVTVLANVDGESLRPFLAVLLLLVGLRMLWRFRREPHRPAHDGDDAGADPTSAVRPEGDFDRRGLGFVALLGGMTNGLVGAWGPVLTPVLMHRRGLEPRIAVGSVNAAEVAVAVVAAGSLLASVGGGGIEVSTLLALLVGGTAAAPVAAWTVRRVPARMLGLGAGLLLLATNVHALAGHVDVPPAEVGAYVAVPVLGALAALAPRLQAHRELRAAPLTDPA